MRSFLWLTCCIFFLSLNAIAQNVIDIDAASDYYEPDDVTVAPGDIVRWTWIEGIHDESPWEWSRYGLKPTTLERWCQ